MSVSGFATSFVLGVIHAGAVRYLSALSVNLPSKQTQKRRSTTGIVLRPRKLGDPRLGVLEVLAHRWIRCTWRGSLGQPVGKQELRIVLADGFGGHGGRKERKVRDQNLLRQNYTWGPPKFARRDPHLKWSYESLVFPPSPHFLAPSIDAATLSSRRTCVPVSPNYYFSRNTSGRPAFGKRPQSPNPKSYIIGIQVGLQLVSRGML